MPAPAQTRLSVRVEGIVQGVGFRPFVRNLATSLDLRGSVRNNMAGALIEVEGGAEAVAEFLRRLETEAPPLSVIERLVTAPLPAVGGSGFEISPSDPAG